MEERNPYKRYTIPKFKSGDRVTAKHFLGILILQDIDEHMSRATNAIQWNTSTEDYILGKAKVDNGEVYSETDLKLCE